MAFPRIRQKLSYGWIVVAVCLIIGTVTLGTRYSFGVFFKSIDAEFGLNRTVTSAILSANMVFGSILTLTGGWALDKYGPRKITVVMGLFTGLSLILTSLTVSPWQLFFSYSLLLAIGTGPGYVVASATTSRWFDKKRGLALAIATAGSGLGPAVAAPVATVLLSHFDWRGAYAIMGGISCLTMVALSGLLKKPAETGVSPDTTAESRDGPPRSSATGNGRPDSFSARQAFRTRSFWFLATSWLFYALAFNMIVTHIIPHATDIGISPVNAAIVLALIGFTSFPARVVVGAMSDRMGRKKAAVICGLTQAIATVWLVGLHDLWALYVFAVVYGIGYGGYDTPVAALVGDLFGLRNLGVIIGGVAAGWAIGAALGPAIGGYVFDVTGSYTIAFLVAALAMFAGIFCVLFTRKEMV